MKPICTIYWIRDGTENCMNFYDARDVERFVRGLKKDPKAFYWICWTSLSARVVA